MLGTYHSVRLGVGIIGLLLVLSIGILGPVVDGTALRGSMSAYYYSELRNVFVGLLVAIGSLLYLYKGFSTAENVTLNLAGLLAVGVAWLPTSPEGVQRDIFGWGHVACAVLFFLCIAYISVFRADDTLSLVKKAEDAKRYRLWYRILGAGMVASPVLALIASAMLDPAGNNRSIVFFIEAAGVVMFAAFWLVKTYEMRTGVADAVAAQARLRKSEDPSKKRSSPGRLVVEEHEGAYREMLEDLAARKGGQGVAAALALTGSGEDAISPRR